MPRKTTHGRIDAGLKRAVKKLLTDTMADQAASLTDKCRAVDRALKLAAIEAKMNDGDYGSGFNNGGDDDAAD